MLDCLRRTISSFPNAPVIGLDVSTSKVFINVYKLLKNTKELIPWNLFTVVIFFIWTFIAPIEELVEDMSKCKWRETVAAQMAKSQKK